MHFCTKNCINKEICLMLNIYSSLTVVLLLILHIFTKEKKCIFKCLQPGFEIIC